MSVSQKTNPVPQVTSAKVEPETLFRHIIVSAKAARTAALELCYSSAAFILVVTHFRDAKDKGYMTRGDARDYLSKQIKVQAGVQGGMLDIYIRNADKLAGILMGSAKMFSPVLQRLGTADKPDTMTGILADWMNASYSDKGLRRKIDSLSALSEALGYETGRKSANVGALTADKVPDRIASAVKAVEKIVFDGDKSGKKVPARVITSAIASAIPKEQSLSLAREAVKRITDPDDLSALETAIKEQRQTLKTLSDKAKAEVTAGTKTTTTKAKTRKPAVVEQTSA